MTHLMYLTMGAILLPSSESVHVHALEAKWEIKNDKVVVEAWYSDETPAQEADVRVFLESDRTKALIDVKTDERGLCEFPRPEPGKYRMVVDAGAGHRKELAMDIEGTATRSEGPSREEVTSYRWRS